MKVKELFEQEKKFSELDHYCERCGEKLKYDKIVWLEMNFKDGKYYKNGTVPENESQGCFAFGSACAKQTLAGNDERIRKNR